MATNSQLKPPRKVLVIPTISTQPIRRPIALTAREDRDLSSLASVIMRQPKLTPEAAVWLEFKEDE